MCRGLHAGLGVQTKFFTQVHSHQALTIHLTDGLTGALNRTAQRTGRLGGTLTVIYTAQTAVPQSKSRGVLLPLLIVLFLFSYGILTLLVVEQGHTIEAQRSLLREMLKDSTQLAGLKEKLAREVAVGPHDKPVQTEQKQAVAGTSPNVAPKIPNAPGKDVKRPGKSARIKKESPEKPAADLQDVRRSTRVI
jgi:hypothetical protein